MNHTKRFPRGVVILSASLIASSAMRVSAYQVSCNGDPFQVQYLSSVIGEARPAEVGPQPATRFHNGVDIPACRDGQTVEAIEGGTVQACPIEGSCLRIRNASGHAFDYVHIQPIVSIGTTVAAGDPIGTVPGNHLHLNEIQDVVKVNPQRPGALDFVDGDVPQFANTTVGGVTHMVIPIKEYTAGEDGTNPSPEVLERLGVGTAPVNDLLHAVEKAAVLGHFQRLDALAGVADLDGDVRAGRETAVRDDLAATFHDDGRRAGVQGALERVARDVIGRGESPMSRTKPMMPASLPLPLSDAGPFAEAQEKSLSPTAACRFQRMRLSSSDAIPRASCL